MSLRGGVRVIFMVAFGLLHAGLWPPLVYVYMMDFAS